jgi:hypothetical protein
MMSRSALAIVLIVPVVLAVTLALTVTAWLTLSCACVILFLRLLQVGYSFTVEMVHDGMSYMRTGSHSASLDVIQRHRGLLEEWVSSQTPSQTSVDQPRVHKKRMRRIKSDFI